MKSQQDIWPSLIKRCLQGDRTAFAQIYELAAPKLMSLCRRYAQDNMEAEDILQESFVKIFRSLPSYRGEGPFQGWMRRITVHTALRTIEKNRKRSTSDLPIEETAADISGLDHLNEEEIIQHIQKLPDGYRTVFNLYEIEGYSHQEIGDLLGITASTSRSQLTKAKKMLQQQLQPYYSHAS